MNFFKEKKPTLDSIYVETVHAGKNLGPKHLEMWKDLSNSAAIPNPFYEPWNLLPALELLDHNPVDLIFVWQDESRSLLLGFIPIEVRDTFRKLSLRNSVSWCHIHSYLATPLLRHQYESVVYEQILTYIDKCSPHQILLSLRNHSFLASTEHILQQKAQQQNRFFSGHEKEHRAMLDATLSFDKYYTTNISTKRRKEYRRQRKRLAELGELKSICYTETSDPDELDFYIESLLIVENTGWKKERGSSILANPQEEQYVRKQFKIAAKEQKLHIQLLLLDGRPIAGISCYLTRPIAYLFKIGHLSEYEQYSPGVLVILDISKEMCDMKGIEKVDSCSKQGHPMIEKLWRDKQTIVQYRLSTQHFLSFSLLRILTSIRKLFSTLQRQIVAYEKH